MKMFLVKYQDAPQAAYPRKIQAEVYASGFLKPCEIVEGEFNECLSVKEKGMSEYKEAFKIICELCKRLNPQHTGNPDTCDCDGVQFLRRAIAAQPSPTRLHKRD